MIDTHNTNTAATYTHTDKTVQAIAALYTAYQCPLVAHLLRIVGQRETAEDLCQETFIKALRAWERHGPNTNVQAWLFRIATNTAYDYLRRRCRVRFVPLDQVDMPTTDDHEVVGRLDTATTVTRALRCIPPRYRVPLLLHYWADRSVQDIAALLECPSATIRVRLFRGRAQLREALQQPDRVAVSS